MNIVSKIRELSKLMNEISSFDQSINKENLHFSVTHKLVIEDGPQILRIEDATAIKTRIELYKIGKRELGFEFFLKETLEEDFGPFALSSQRKIKPFIEAPVQKVAFNGLNYSFSSETRLKDQSWEFSLCNRVYHDYGEENYIKLHDFFHKYRILGVHKGNVGIGVDDKIQCFDYIANFALGGKNNDK